MPTSRRPGRSSAGARPWPTPWAACHGAQRGAAELLLGRGADLNWVATWDGLTPLDAARRSKQEGLDPAELVAWLLARGAKSASELG